MLLFLNMGGSLIVFFKCFFFILVVLILSADTLDVHVASVANCFASNKEPK